MLAPPAAWQALRETCTHEEEMGSKMEGRVHVHVELRETIWECYMCHSMYQPHRREEHLD